MSLLSLSAVFRIEPLYRWAAVVSERLPREARGATFQNYFATFAWQVFGIIDKLPVSRRFRLASRAVADVVAVFVGARQSGGLSNS